MTTYELTTRPTAATVRAARPHRFRWLRELGLLVGLYAGYSAARLLGDSDLAGATANAHDLLALERTLHIDIEGCPRTPRCRPGRCSRSSRATGTRCCTTSSRRPSWSGSTAAATATTRGCATPW